MLCNSTLVFVYFFPAVSHFLTSCVKDLESFIPVDNGAMFPVDSRNQQGCQVIVTGRGLLYEDADTVSTTKHDVLRLW